MTRTNTNREQMIGLVHATPFQPFILMMDKGQQIVVEHPENFAYDATASEASRGWDKFSVITGGLFVFSTFGAVSTVNLLDRGQVVG